MEDYVATDERPVDKCLADVAASDVYVGIFAWRYGHVPKESNPRQLSITELEYRMAGEVLKPRLIFLLDDEAPWVARHMDAITGENDHGRRIADLRAHLQATSISSFFAVTEQLAGLVGAAMQQIAARSRVAYQLYIDHMERFAGARSEDEALARYLPLRLQDTKAEPTGQGSSLALGTLEGLVEYPAVVMLVGDPGSGKTTSVLHEAQRLAKYSQATPAAPFPVFVPLGTFRGSSLLDLLSHAARCNSMAPREVLALWREQQRPLGLLLDGADDAPDRLALAAVITELLSGGAGVFHSVAVTCKPGAAQQLLRERTPGLHELLILPLDDMQLDEFLGRYGAGELRALLSPRLRETLRRPDVVAALSQATRHSKPTQIPDSPGQIYRLYVNQILEMTNAHYDAAYVKRPVLTLLAHLAVESGQAELICDDRLYDTIAATLSRINRRYRRRRQLMPSDWTAEGVVNELVATSVLERVPDAPGTIRFTKQVYRDYFLATFLAENGPNSAFLRDLLGGPNPGEGYQPLSILLGIAPNAADYFDSVPANAVPLVAQLWIEHASDNAVAPGPLRESFEHALCDLGPTIEAPEVLPLARHLHPHERYAYLLDLAARRPIPAIEPLIDLSQDDNPVVRAAAQYALLRWGECGGRNELVVNRRQDRLTLVVSGGGLARIGPYTLVNLAHPAAAHVVMNLGDDTLDPFDCPTVFRFLHTPPDLFAAMFFEERRAVDWLNLLVELRKIAYVMAQIVSEARGRLGDVLSELDARAKNFAAFGQCIARDLKIPWTPIYPPVEMAVSTERVEQNYSRLRQFFSRGNQERALLAARSDKDADIQAVQNAETVEGRVFGLSIGWIEIEGDNDRKPVQYAFLSVVQNVKFLREGKLNGIVVKSLQSRSANLPLVLRVNSVINVDRAQCASIRGYRINAFDGPAYPWKAEIVINVKRCSGTTIQGAVVKEAAVNEANKRPTEG
jgi:hypothetical protein